MSTVPTSTAIRALAAAVRDRELTTVWRGNLVTLLHNVATAVMLAPPTLLRELITREYDEASLLANSVVGEYITCKHRPGRCAGLDVDAQLRLVDRGNDATSRRRGPISRWRADPLRFTQSLCDVVG